eukprot:TRINITY_DN5155_c1_g1_i13.p1 TRINITY_DN5155_c1_g1~~TRINITY_DN5155_c1_g1_i13.p1  ORF type:complete len:107 (-),score=26.56 TRINITY_DN5155_c1_g1_i13:81-401(-)
MEDISGGIVGNATEMSASSEGKSIFCGKSVVFTGTMKSFSRAQGQELITKLGGQFRTSITKQVNFLVVGSEGGAGDRKLALAATYGIRVLEEEEFVSIVRTVLGST